VKQPQIQQSSASLLHHRCLTVRSVDRCTDFGMKAAAQAEYEEEIADALVAIAPVAGLSRVVAAAPEVAIALGYDVVAALEEPMGQ
jgi:hypothetical protein